MNKDYFIELLHKYLEGNATQEECRLLLSYYNLFDAEPDVLALLSEEQKEQLKNQIQIGIWQRIRLHEENKEAKSFPWEWTTRVAASLLVVAICVAGMYLFYQSAKTENTIARSDQSKEDRLVRLPDSSTVIVSAGSKLTYPFSFEGLAKREVYLVGQAYFDVKHNTWQPFVVHTGKLKTMVLGTAFHIKAWPADENISIKVTRGKVEVADQHAILGIIKPDEHLIYNKANGDVVQEALEPRVNPALQEKDLILEDATVAEAFELLEQRFKVNITCNDKSLRSKRFTTTFQKSETLEQILKSICEFNNTLYHYDKEKRSVVIKGK